MRWENLLNMLYKSYKLTISVSIMYNTNFYLSRVEDRNMTIFQYF